MTIDPTKVYVPDQVAIVTNHELQALGEAMPSEISQLDDVDPGSRYLAESTTWIHSSARAGLHPDVKNDHIGGTLSHSQPCVVTVLAFMVYS